MRQIWDCVEPGGQLLLSVPCASTEFEEYLNFNEYGLVPTEDGYSFGQRFYSAALLRDRIFSVTGPHRRLAIFGERVPGTFIRWRDDRLMGNHPVQLEILRTRSQFTWWPSIDAVPGVGVVMMEFAK